jgi:hypothetical protein
LNSNIQTLIKFGVKQSVMMIAHAHKIAFIVSAAVSCGQSVMNHIDRNVPSLFYALLTKRMRFNVSFPYLPPLVPVMLIRIRVTAVVVILKVTLAFMVVAVITVC